MISGIENNYEGCIYFDDVDVSNLSIRKRDLSYMPQNYMVYEKMSVFDNIAFPLKFYDYTPEDIIVRVRNIAKRLKIAHCLSRRPKDLSIGQQQRMALAKVLVKDPSLILLDESLTSNDPETKNELFNLIKEAQVELNATIIYITHDYMDAIRYGDKLYVLKDSKVVVSGTPNELRDSKDEYLQALKASSIYNGK